jgi:hypothetical protein
MAKRIRSHCALDMRLGFVRTGHSATGSFPSCLMRWVAFFMVLSLHGLGYAADGDSGRVRLISPADGGVAKTGDYGGVALSVEPCGSAYYLFRVWETGGSPEEGLFSHETSVSMNGWIPGRPYPEWKWGTSYSWNVEADCKGDSSRTSETRSFVLAADDTGYLPIDPPAPEISDMPLRSELRMLRTRLDSKISWIHYEVAWDSSYQRIFRSGYLNLDSCQTDSGCPLRLELDPGSTFFLRTFTAQRTVFPSGITTTWSSMSNTVRLRTASLAQEPSVISGLRASGDSVLFSVDLARGADKVRMQVSEDTGFTAVAKEWVDAAYFPPERVHGSDRPSREGPLQVPTWAHLATGKRYYVRARNEWGKYPGPWSRISSFELPFELIPLQPAANSVINSPSVVLSWRPVANATGYAVTARVPGNVEGWTLFEDRVTTDTFLVLENPPRGHRVQWYFKAALNHDWTHSSDTLRSFRVSKVIPSVQDSIIPLLEGNRWKYAVVFRSTGRSSVILDDGNLFMTKVDTTSTYVVDFEIVDAANDADGNPAYQMSVRITDTLQGGTLTQSEARVWIKQDYSVNPPRLVDGTTINRMVWTNITSNLSLFDPRWFCCIPNYWYAYRGSIGLRIRISSTSDYMQGIGALSLLSDYGRMGALAEWHEYLDARLLEFNGVPFVPSELVPSGGPPRSGVRPSRQARTSPSTGRISGWLAPLSSTPAWTEATVYSLTGGKVAMLTTAAQAASLRPSKGLYLVRVRSPAGIRMLKAFAP